MQEAVRNMVLGSKSAGEVFKEAWTDHGFVDIKADGGEILTVPIQRVVNSDNKDAKDRYKGMVRKSLSDMQSKQMTATEVQSYVPLVYDPEILQILFQNAPFKESIAAEGQQGYKAVYQRIDTREAPLGFLSESSVIDLSGNSGKTIGFKKEETSMVIYVDLVDISDFTQAAAEHYMSVQDTTLGERLGLFAQKWEQQMLYGDTSKSTGTGGLGDSNGFDGLAKIFSDAGNEKDKSSVTSGFIKDIKGEIHELRQNQALNISDLMIVTSWTFFDKLSNELVPANQRFEATGAMATSADVGIMQLRIAGVPVMATHNVDEFTDSGYTIGDQNDVFIVNTRAVRNRYLVPLSTVPLGKLGLSERSAIFQFGAMIERSGGNWGRYLKNYNNGGT